MSEEIELNGVEIEEACRQSGQVGVDPSVRKEQAFIQKPAGFWIRFWAYLIDLIVIGAIGGLLIKPIFRITGFSITDPVFLLYSPYKLMMLVVFLAYFLLMTKYLGQTAGKMILGIRVIAKSGAPLGWGTLVFREVIGRYVSKTLLIPYLLVIFMPRKEALHDLFADTEVVHEQVYEKTAEKVFASEGKRPQLQGEQSI